MFPNPNNLRMCGLQLLPYAGQHAVQQLKVAKAEKHCFRPSGPLLNERAQIKVSKMGECFTSP